MSQENDESEGFPWLSIGVAVVAAIGMIVCMTLAGETAGKGIRIASLVFQSIVISIIIWQACDPFADAAQWIGKQLRLPGSVRGATLDAVASSMPELFSGIFFVVVAMMAVGNGDPSSADTLAEASGEGFGATIATCAGSAIYNMILIPAICAIFISYYRRERPTIDVDEKVIARDGLWFLGCELVLIVFLFQNRMHWWMGLALIGLYIGYVFILYSDARSFRQKVDILRAKISGGLNPNEAIDQMRAEKIRVSRDLIDRFADEDTEEEEEDTAGVLFGLLEIPLNFTSAWAIIAVATLIAAATCYWLVEVTNSAAALLAVPVFFVAVILAAAASSVPDTFLSIGSAKRGDDDGAVSNAFGSNIFDIAICLSIPMLLAMAMNGWQPIELTQDGKPMPGLVGLRILLCVLTIATLLIMWHNRQLTRNKAFILCGLYMVFVGYAIVGSLTWQQ